MCCHHTAAVFLTGVLHSKPFASLSGCIPLFLRRPKQVRAGRNEARQDFTRPEYVWYFGVEGLSHIPLAPKFSARNGPRGSRSRGDCGITSKSRLSRKVNASSDACLALAPWHACPAALWHNPCGHTQYCRPSMRPESISVLHPVIWENRASECRRKPRLANNPIAEPASHDEVQAGAAFIIP
jgi:hypothetical protein